MDNMGGKKPLLMERPQRGREMVSKQVPGGLVGEGQRKTLVHEGYVGDTKFMVPDTNLDIMKQLVDMQFGGRQFRGPQVDQDKASILDDQKGYKNKSKVDPVKGGSRKPRGLTGEDTTSSSDSDDDSTSADEDATSGKTISSKGLSEQSKLSKADSAGKKTGKRQPSTKSDITSSSSGTLDIGSTSSKATSKGTKPSNESSETSSYSTTSSKPSGTSKSTKDLSGINLSKTPTSKGTTKPSNESSETSSYSTTSSKPSGTSKSTQDSSGVNLSKTPTNVSDVSKGSKGLPKAAKELSERPASPYDLTKILPTFNISPEQSKLTKSYQSLPYTDEQYREKTYYEPYRESSNKQEKLRFLISGHIKEQPSAKPIFICHQYNGKSPFKHEKPDFTNERSEGNINIAIQGKFYKKSVLKEEHNFPVSLNLTPDTIIAIDSRSKVWENEFSEGFQVGDHSVRLYGQFIKIMRSGKYTPILGLQVQNLL